MKYATKSSRMKEELSHCPHRTSSILLTNLLNKYHLCTTTPIGLDWAPKGRVKWLQNSTTPPQMAYLGTMVCLQGIFVYIDVCSRPTPSDSGMYHALTIFKGSMIDFCLPSGAMGSYVAFYLAGLYPLPATRQFLLSSPFFPEISFFNPIFGKTTTIKAKNFKGNPVNGTGGTVFVKVR